MARDSAPPPADEPDDLEAAQAAALTVDARAGDAELVTAIAAAMAHAGAVTKSSRNAEQNYSYASAESILEATRGPLLERGVLLIQRPRDWTVEEVRSRSGTAGTAITLELDFEFTNGRSTFTIERWRGQGQDYGDKAYGKAYTNAVKTFIRAQWLLPTGDDPEASPSGERVARDTPPPAAAEPPAWTRAATAEERAKVIPVLREVLGDSDEATARRYGAALAQACGGFPIAVVEWLSVLGQWREVAANARRGAQDAAAEEPDTPAPEPETQDPGPEPEPDGPDEAPRELADMTTEELLAELRAMGVDAPSSDKWSKAALINAVRHGRGGAAASPSPPSPRRRRRRRLPGRAPPRRRRSAPRDVSAPTRSASAARATRPASPSTRRHARCPATASRSRPWTPPLNASTRWPRPPPSGWPAGESKTSSPATGPAS
jgi:hypothetical protein